MHVHLILIALCLFTNTHIKLVIGREGLLQWEKVLALTQCLHLMSQERKYKDSWTGSSSEIMIVFLFLLEGFYGLFLHFLQGNSSRRHLHRPPPTVRTLFNPAFSTHLKKKCPLLCRHNSHSPYLHDYHDITGDQTPMACQTHSQPTCTDQRSSPCSTE